MKCRLCQKEVTMLHPIHNACVECCKKIRIMEDFKKLLDDTGYSGPRRN